MLDKPDPALFEKLLNDPMAGGMENPHAGDGLIRQDKWPEAFEVVGLGQPPDEILEDREEDGSPWATWLI